MCAYSPRFRWIQLYHHLTHWSTSAGSHDFDMTHRQGSTLAAIRKHIVSCTLQYSAPEFSHMLRYAAGSPAVPTHIQVIRMYSQSVEARVQTLTENKIYILTRAHITKRLPTDQKYSAAHISTYTHPRALRPASTQPHTRMHISFRIRRTYAQWTYSCVSFATHLSERGVRRSSPSRLRIFVPGGQKTSHLQPNTERQGTERGTERDAHADKHNSVFHDANHDSRKRPLLVHTHIDTHSYTSNTSAKRSIQIKYTVLLTLTHTPLHRYSYNNPSHMQMLRSGSVPEHRQRSSTGSVLRDFWRTPLQSRIVYIQSLTQHAA
jgi:hypothetical protein